jgi:hypothetical protein
LEIALNQCNNSYPGLDGLRFSLFKALSIGAKLCLLGINNDILAMQVVPQSWHRTRAVTIVKPGKDSLLSSSYRPISLLACGRKLMEKMICTRLDFWAEKNGILSPTQYGFRKEKGTRDCVAILTTDISTSFEMKKQNVAAFLDISEAYDNVLIEVLCGVMLEKELHLGIVRFMWSLLSCKTSFSVLEVLSV